MDSRTAEEKQETSALQITLIDADQTIKSLWLPQKAEGKFRFSGNGIDSWYDFFYLEGSGEKWYAVCTADAYIQTGSEELKKVCSPFKRPVFDHPARRPGVCSIFGVH